MAEAGRAEAAITWLQACARIGILDALQIAVQLLSGVGREEEAQSLRRFRVGTGCNSCQFLGSPTASGPARRRWAPCRRNRELISSQAPGSQ